MRSSLTDRRPIPVTSLVRCAPFGEVAEQVEGAPLLREYGLKRSIEGSNPSLSANSIRGGTRFGSPLLCCSWKGRCGRTLRFDKLAERVWTPSRSGGARRARDRPRSRVNPSRPRFHRVDELIVPNSNPPLPSSVTHIHVLAAIPAELQGSPGRQSLRLLDAGCGNCALIEILHRSFAALDPALLVEICGFDISDPHVQMSDFLAARVRRLLEPDPTQRRASAAHRKRGALARDILLYRGFIRAEVANAVEDAVEAPIRPGARRCR